VGFLNDMKKNVVIAVLFVLHMSAAVADKVAIDYFLNDSTVNGAFIGIAVKDLAADSLIYECNSDLRFTPASNLKLFTSAAAIEILDVAYKFVTSFYTNGNLSSEGDLNGDLLIVGGGDPLISGRFRESVVDVLKLWCDSLHARGIKEIMGDLVIDNTFFEDDDLGPGWSHDDLTYWYACPISALSFNDNCVDIYVYPGGEVGKSCRIVLDPLTDYIDTVNNTITQPSGFENTFDFYRYPGTNIVQFFGCLAIDDASGVVDYVSVVSPHLYCADVFRNIMSEQNIDLKGEIVEVSAANRPLKYDINNLVKLFDWYSDSMGVMISVINKNSQNFFAEQTLKTLGAEICGEGSFKVSTGLVRDWLESIGITSDDIGFHDGSGLSYLNMAKPSAIIKLLQYMFKSPNFAVYYESLAIPGVDRSVRQRMPDHPMASMMRTKTGHIGNTRTFSGYLTTKSDRLMAFSLMVNHYSTSIEQIDKWFDKLCGYIIDNY
jgi:D-alanyl-D-alanine carboxypeptidase/D-alanyl-D-alanine-endopeptidase (penicillin-binding protein 4)